MSAGSVVQEVLQERQRQNKKWEGKRSSIGTTLDDDPGICLAILTEEVGEVAQEVLRRDPICLREELIQVAAVAVAWIEDLDRKKVTT